MAAEWSLSATPGDRLPPLPLPDWIFHGLFCAALGFALLWPLGGGARGPSLALLLLALYGAVDEFHQAWVPGRNPSLTDWLADVTGGALVTLVAAARRATRSRRPGPGRART